MSQSPGGTYQAGVDSVLLGLVSIQHAEGVGKVLQMGAAWSCRCQAVSVGLQSAVPHLRHGLTRTQQVQMLWLSAERHCCCSALSSVVA